MNDSIANGSSLDDILVRAVSDLATPPLSTVTSSPHEKPELTINNLTEQILH